MATWYDNLEKPPFTPPKSVFGPVWAVLYIFIFSAVILYFLSPVKTNLIPVTVFLLIHFTASFSWTKLFFEQKKIFAALLDILVIDVTLGVVITLFFSGQHSCRSAPPSLPLLGNFCRISQLGNLQTESRQKWKSAVIKLTEITNPIPHEVFRSTTRQNIRHSS